MGSWVVYVTGLTGAISFCERLTLSKRTLREVDGRERGAEEGADLELLMVHQIQYESSPSADRR